MSGYECSGCGMRSCDGRCFDECPLDYEQPTYASFIEKCDCIEQLVEVELKEMPSGRLRAAA